MLATPGKLIRGWMERRAHQGRSVALGYRQILILPTRGGLVFTAMVLAIWVGAVNYSNNMAFVLCFLLLGLALVAMIHTFRNLLGLQITAAYPEPVFAGGHAHVPVRIDNNALRPRYGIVLRAAANRPAVTKIPQLDSRSAMLPVATRHRGLHPLPVVVVESVFPGGLFRAWSRVALEATCAVYPKPETGRVPEPKSHASTGSERPTGQGDDEFTGLRPYQPADPLKRIAWRTLAQGQEIQTKQFAGETPDRVWLDYDTIQGLAPEARLSRLCRWILDAEQAGRPYGLALPGRRLAPATGPAHKERCLEALARFPD